MDDSTTNPEKSKTFFVPDEGLEGLEGLDDEFDEDKFIIGTMHSSSEEPKEFFVLHETFEYHDLFLIFKSIEFILYNNTHQYLPNFKNVSKVKRLNNIKNKLYNMLYKDE